MLDMSDIARTPLRQLMPSVWYPAFAPDIPDVLVLRWPEDMPRGRRQTGLNARYKAIFVETLGDRRAAEDALDRPLLLEGNVVRMKATIDRPNARRSTLPTSRDLRALHYAPPEEGWPHLVVVMSGFVTGDPSLMRGRYLASFHADEEGAAANLAEVARVAGMSGLDLDMDGLKGAAR